MRNRGRCLGTIAALLTLAGGAYGFGPQGHALVGAIADQRLAASSTATKVKDLLDGITLERAATLADEIKDWDKDAPPDPEARRFPECPKLEKDLITFHASNPQHHEYHYTDVPVEGSSKYGSGATGRSDHDIVQMIPFCVHVLDGSTPETNPKKITKRVAVALLAHYMGDLHQPLHVGAEYFDSHRRPTNPDLHSGAGFGDQGGNKILLTIGSGSHSNSYKLHGYWDGETVEDAIRLEKKEMHAGGVSGAISNEQLAKYFAGHAPTASTFPAGSNIDTETEIWANEILPLAREAHSRLTYSGAHIDTHTHSANAHAKPDPSTGNYADFAGKAIKSEIPLGGARLADVLKAVLP